MTDNFDIIDRLTEYCNSTNLSQAKFAESIGMEQKTVNNYFNRSRKISFEFVEKTIRTFGLDANWFLSGQGSMFKTKISTTSDQAIGYRLVPLLNLDAVGGMHKANLIAEDPEYIEKLIPFTDAQEGDVALTISGDSMSPTCPAGSKVLIREVSNWKEYFGFGNIFVILLTDGRRILKEVQKFQEDSKNYILCKSHNDKYPEEELPKSMIQGVWKVVKILNERGW